MGAYCIIPFSPLSQHKKQQTFWWIEQLGNVVILEEDSRAALGEEVYTFHARIRQAMEASQAGVHELERDRREAEARIARDIKHLPAEEAYGRRDVVLSEGDAFAAIAGKGKKEEVYDQSPFF